MSSLRNWLAGAVAVLVLAVPSYASAQASTIAELQALIAQLLAQLAALQTQQGSEFTWEATGEPLTVEFTYTMNQGNTCDGGTYYLYFGDEDKPAGEEPQILNFPADLCNGYVQHSVHTYDEPGVYTATLYDKKGNALLGSVDAKVGDNEDIAQDLIDEAEDLIDSAQDAIDDSDDPEDTIEEADELVDEAEDLLDDAQDAFDDEEYDDAIDFAQEAIELANEAIDLLLGSSSEEEVVDVDVEVIGSAQGVAPFTATVEVQVETQSSACSTNDFMGTLDWGDGTEIDITAGAVSTTLNNSVCTKSMVAVPTHTYTSAGAFEVEFTSDVGGLIEEVDILVTGYATGDATGTVTGGTFTTGTPTISGTAYNTGAVGFYLVKDGDKEYGSGKIPVNSNNRWAHTVTENLADGTYDLYLDNYAKNTQLAETQITIKKTRTELPAPTCSVSVSPRSTTSGRSVTVSWTSKGADYVLYGGAQKSASGSFVDTPSSSTTYSLIAIGSQGKGSCSASVEVFTITPGSVQPSDLRSPDPVIDFTRPTPNTSNISAAALMSVTGQLDAILKGFKELFGN